VNTQYDEVLLTDEQLCRFCRIYQKL